MLSDWRDENGSLTDAATAEVQKASPMERPEVIYRHSGMVRVTHWITRWCCSFCR